MRFLDFGDRPRHSLPLYAWVQYSRIGSETRRAVSDGRGVGFPQEKSSLYREIIDRDLALFRDDEELIELIPILLRVLED